jgi:hypothetical protein
MGVWMKTSAGIPEMSECRLDARLTCGQRNANAVIGPCDV